MQTIPINEITISKDRQRSSLDDQHILDLAESITINGLLHPIILRNEDDLTLVAGECRLTAIKFLHQADLPFSHDNLNVPLNTIPYTFLGDLSEDAYIEAELSENLNRLNLTWQEEAAAKARLHKLRTKQVEDRFGEGEVPPQEKQTLRKTAAELKGKNVGGQFVSDLKADIELIESFEAVPELQKAKTKKEALKILERKKEAEVLADAALTIDMTSIDHRLLKGDAAHLVPSLDETYDLICIDPPYGIDAHKDGLWSGLSHNYNDSEDYALSIIKQLSSVFYEKTYEEAALLMFCDIEHFVKLKAILSEAGWWVWQRPCIWYKGNIGSFPEGRKGYRKTYECFLYASKGKKEFHTIQHDVFIVPQFNAGKKHAAEKPSRLYWEIMKELVSPGDKILDCFMGSGSILAAANTLSCIVTGVELDEESYNIALSRVNDKMASDI